MFAVIACSYLYSTHSVIRHSTCFNCHSWKNEKWKNEFICVFITSFSSVPDSSMFFVQYKETLRHLINKAFLRYNMWCYYFQTFHKEILHDGESRILFPAAISLQTPTLVMPLTLSTSPFSCPAIPKTYNFLPK